VTSSHDDGSSLPCSCPVYRAVTKRAWIDPTTGRLLPAAFVRRTGRDTDGLSVCLFEGFPSDPDELRRHIDAVTHLHCHALASLIAGHVRNLGLDVVADSPTHASITVLPYDDDIAESRHRAVQLARLCWMRWHRRRQEGWDTVPL